MKNLQNIHIYEYALPFDYMRCRFDKVIHLLQNDFTDFLPIRDGSDGHNDVIDMNGHIFFHHKVQNDEVRNSFLRRIDRFKNLILSPSESLPPITFLRGMTSDYISTEMNQIESFVTTIIHMNPSLSFQLVMVGHRDDDKSLISFQEILCGKYLNVKIYYFSVPNYLTKQPDSYKKVIIYIHNNGFPTKKGYFDEKTMEPIEPLGPEHSISNNNYNYGFVGWRPENINEVEQPPLFEYL